MDLVDASTYAKSGSTSSNAKPYSYTGHTTGTTRLIIPLKAKPLPFQIQQGTETLRREAPALLDSMGFPNMPTVPTSTASSTGQAPNQMGMMQQMLQQMRFKLKF